MADPKDQKGQQRDRATGSQPRPIPERERSSGEFGAERDRNSDSIKAPRPIGGQNSGARERSTASMAAPKTTGERERVTQKMGEVRERNTGAQGAITVPTHLTDHQRRLLSSAFQDAGRLNHLRSVVGGAGGPNRDDDDEPTALGKMFDGVTAAKELTNRDLFKAVQAPVQSREGRRTKDLLQQVINQFAVGNNPRYTPDGPDRGRAHILIWDVSRAMNCEVPHFVGIKELTLGQTVDWLRHEGPVRGWMKGGAPEAVNAAREGLMVIAVPKEVRIKQMGVVTTLPPDPDGRPRLAAAAMKVGNNLSVYEALGVYAADYFIHP
jgi:hypothetical protein